MGQFLATNNTAGVIVFETLGNYSLAIGAIDVDLLTVLNGFDLTDVLGNQEIQTLIDSGDATFKNNDGSIITSVLTDIPVYLSNVNAFANLAGFPATGKTNVIYIAIDTNLIYRWNGATYTIIGDAELGATWEDILTNGSSTNGQQPTITLLDSIYFETDNEDGLLKVDDAASFAAERTWTLPDASGTIALTNQLGKSTWADTLSNGNVSGGNNAKMTLEDKIQGLATANFINFNDSENDGIFIKLISGLGTIQMFETSLDLVHSVIARLQSPIFTFTTESFRLKDTSSGFASLIDMNLLTANRVQQLPDKAGIFAMVTDIPTTLSIKSGALDSANFAGVPRTLNVVFSTPFIDANYSPVITGIPNRNFTVENVTNTGFTVNSNAAAAMVGLVYWTATYHGEVSGN